jgi:hypothetical protein
MHTRRAAGACRHARIFLFFSPFSSQKFTFGPPEILFARLDPNLGATACGAEVTQLDATACGAELPDVAVPRGT